MQRLERSGDTAYRGADLDERVPRQLAFGGCRLDVGDEGLHGCLERVDLLPELLVCRVLRLIGVGDDLIRRLLELVGRRVFELDVAETLDRRLQILQALTDLGLVAGTTQAEPYDGSDCGDRNQRTDSRRG